MEGPIHFRRCHVCGEITYNVGRLVDRCCKCSKPMAPFFYFDDFSVSTFGDNSMRPPLANGEIQPIRGLTVLWDTDNQ